MVGEEENAGFIPSTMAKVHIQEDAQDLHPCWDDLTVTSSSKPAMPSGPEFILSMWTTSFTAGSSPLSPAFEGLSNVF